MSDRRCRLCGCTDLDCSGCIERTGSPCSWVAHDLCSACVAEPLDLVGIHEAAEILGLSKPWVSMFLHDHATPVATLRCGRIWRRADVEAVAKARGRA